MRSARWMIAAVTVMVAMTGVAAMAQDSGDLAEVEARLDEIAAEIEQAEAAANAAGAALENADERLAEVEAIVNQLAMRLAAQQERVDDARAHLDRLEARAAEVQAAFDARAVEMYKHSFGSDLDAVLSAGSIQEALDRRTLLTQVNESDRATVEQVRAAQGAVITQQQVLSKEVDRLATLKAEQEVVLEQVREIRESRALAAANAEARVEELAHEENHLQAEQDRIEEIIAERQAAVAAAAAAAAGAETSNVVPVVSAPSASGFIWPVCGNVTSEYGYRWGRLHAGLDIDDNLTSAIAAAASGVVIYTGYHGGYGNMTIIDHGGGITTAYAHQSSIAVGEGQSVSQGQRIGTIGTTGSSTGTHLHFEVRVNGSARNPRGFLPGGC